MQPIATIIVPTHDHADTLYASVKSALMQTVSEIEIFIIGDGVPDRTREIVKELMADDRIRFVDRPKSPRNGEPYRHELLQQINSKIVCYLSDDDLYFPDHVEIMLQLLEEADFANTLPLYFDRGVFRVLIADLSSPANQEVQVRGLKGRFGLPYGAHTLDFYHRLPHGWRTTPPGSVSDQYMWQQCLSLADGKFVSSFVPTVLKFPAPTRKHLTPQERRAELDLWLPKLLDPAQRDQLRRDAVTYTAQSAAAEICEATIEQYSLIMQKLALESDLQESKAAQLALTQQLETAESTIAELEQQLGIWINSHAVQEQTARNWQESSEEMQRKLQQLQNSRTQKLVNLLRAHK